MKPEIIILVVAAFLVISVYVATKAVQVVRQYEKGILLRLGKYIGLRNPGIFPIVPFVDKVVLVDMRERVLNFKDLKLTDKSGKDLRLELSVFFKVVDPVKSVFEVVSLESSLMMLIRAELLKLNGNYSQEQLMSKSAGINDEISEAIASEVNSWGVKVVRIRIQNIS